MELEIIVLPEPVVKAFLFFYAQENRESKNPPPIGIELTKIHKNDLSNHPLLLNKSEHQILERAVMIVHSIRIPDTQFWIRKGNKIEGRLITRKMGTRATHIDHEIRPNKFHKNRKYFYFFKKIPANSS
jgi:hypothetical protein